VDTVLENEIELIVYVSGLSTADIVEASIDMTPTDDGIVLAMRDSKCA
jgi:hypothetical protein